MLLEVLQQAHLRAAVFRSVCCPPQLAFAGLLGSCRAAAAWPLEQPVVACSHLVERLDTVLVVGDYDPYCPYTRIIVRCRQTPRCRELSYTLRANRTELHTVCFLLDEMTKSLARGMRCHAVVCLDALLTAQATPIYALLASLRRQHGARLRLTFQSINGASASQCAAFEPALIITCFSSLLPQQVQRLLSLDHAVLQAHWDGPEALRVAMRAGGLAALFVGDCTYVVANW